ncbi:24923_t:CDS:1, partial [Dentiscutata erythropus]
YPTRIETLYSSDPFQNYFLFADMLQRSISKESDYITPDLILRNTRHISLEL